MTANNSNISPLVDEFGKLKAQVSDLEAKLAEIRKQLVECGQPVIEGSLYRIAVIKTIRGTLDTSAIKAAMPPSWLDRYTKFADVVTVRVSGR